MCFMKPPKIDRPEAPQPDDPEVQRRRAAELAAAGPGREALRLSGPLGVPNHRGGATALLVG